VSYAKCEVCYTYKREVSYINDYLENAAYWIGHFSSVLKELEFQ
jgi:hypothetical protein